MSSEIVNKEALYSQDSDNDDRMHKLLELVQNDPVALRKIMMQLSSDPDAPAELLEWLKELSTDADYSQPVKNQQEQDDVFMENIERANIIAKQIQAFFDVKQWHVTSMDGHGRDMLLAFKMRNATVRLQILVEPRTQSIRFNIILLTCQDDYRLAMRDYLTQLNHPLRFGAFHIDKADGEVTYRYSTSYCGLPFSEEAFEEYIDACLITVDRNVKEIGEIAFGRFTKDSPNECLNKIEWFKKIKKFAIALSQ